jgi:transposase InsO family protein
VNDLAPMVGIQRACAAMGVPRSSYYRSLQAPRVRPKVPRKASPRALTAAERAVLNDYLHSERFVDRAPRTIYATLLDEGVRICHWRTMYRLLRADSATRERRAIRRHPVYSKPELLATAPRQVWSWDITWLRGPVPGGYYHLYLVLDIFSRMVVGWLVADREDAVLAERLITDACRREAIEPHQLTVHADRGAPMRSQTVADMMADLGITRSHSRPSVSNDNPYSEAQFKTMKYGPTYPDRFASLLEAERWVQTFVTWYNTEHRHSGIGFLTPQMLHTGQAEQVTAHRQAVLDAAYAAHPERFPGGHPSAPEVPTQAWINAPTPTDSSPTTPTRPPVPPAAPGSRDPSAAAPRDAGLSGGNPMAAVACVPANQPYRN